MTRSSFELSEALEQAGDAELLRELVLVLLDEGAKNFERVLAAEKNGDAPALEAAAHALKGAVVVFGAKAIGATLEEIERAARTGMMTECRPLVLRAETEWNALVSSLQAWLATRS